ncbi:MAG: DNA polymerase IV, partial [Candidatus Eremiobacteraeota bacterium]|nr:DNA polymerase IV [Candidatus Eremiobacteraeota bacterium]
MILHADLDAFYASVAQRDDAGLRGKPLVIAGSSRRAVVLTASYEARPFGIHSAMPLYQAKERCAQLIVVPPDFTKYRDASRAVFAIYREHARALEGLSLDEAFLDLGELSLDHAVATATKIKLAVRSATSLTVSVGVASGKMVAKIASDDGKPDGLVAVAPGTEAAYLAHKPVRRLWGIGPKTEQRLLGQGLERIGQIAELSDERLHALFGRWGAEVRELARGIDPRPVSEDWEARSISSEETFEHDMTDIAELKRIVQVQSAELAERLREKHLCAYTVGVKVKLADWRVFGRQTSFVEPVDDADTIAQAAVHCLAKTTIGQPVRLIGVRVTKLAPQQTRQTSLFGS